MKNFFKFILTLAYILISILIGWVAIAMAGILGLSGYLSMFILIPLVGFFLIILLGFLFKILATRIFKLEISWVYLATVTAITLIITAVFIVGLFYATSAKIPK